MFKVFSVVFLIFGTVVGSGFSSGKEIMIYFSRFGNLSYLYITLACVLFFVLFYFFLRFGKNIVEKFENNRLINIISTIITLVFCSSMFAGIESLFAHFSQVFYAILVTILLVGTIFVVKNGVSGLEKANIILMPIASLLFLVVLVYASFSRSDSYPISNSFAGGLYALLYVALNTSISGVVVSKVGDGMTKKQTFFASLFSCLLIFVFLMFGNFVLLKNTASFYSDMPFLTLVYENKTLFALDFCVILVGCFTTLISLVFTLKNSFDKMIKHQNLSLLFAVFVPFLISGLGFSQIVSFLYPICSVFGILILILYLLEGRKIYRL